MNEWLVLALPPAQAFLPWLLVLMAGAGLCAQAQSSRHGLAETLGALAMLLVATMLFGPSSVRNF